MASFELSPEKPPRPVVLRIRQQRIPSDQRAPEDRRLIDKLALPCLTTAASLPFCLLTLFLAWHLLLAPQTRRRDVPAPRIDVARFSVDPNEQFAHGMAHDEAKDTAPRAGISRASQAKPTQYQGMVPFQAAGQRSTVQRSAEASDATAPGGETLQQTGTWDGASKVPVRRASGARILSVQQVSRSGPAVSRGPMENAP